MPLPKRRAADVDAAIGARIRMSRKARRISQQELARHVGVSFQQIQKYENGVNRVAASTLIEIAGALGVSIGDLLPGAGPASARGLRAELEELVELAEALAVAAAYSREGAAVSAEMDCLRLRIAFVRRALAEALEALREAAERWWHALDVPARPGSIGDE